MYDTSSGECCELFIMKQAKKWGTKSLVSSKLTSYALQSCRHIDPTIQVWAHGRWIQRQERPQCLWQCFLYSGAREGTKGMLMGKYATNQVLQKGLMNSRSWV